MNKKLVFATNNLHKLQEVHSLINTFDVIGLDAIGCHEEIPETADTLAGNAFIKANHVLRFYSQNAFADDTGLEVYALDNAPGVYSARFAGPNCCAEANMKKLLEVMADVEDRSAQFRTVIALLIDGKSHFFEGLCKGKIINNKKGNSGFGYDPIFQPDGFDKTFAEMNIQDKGMISHRGKAIKKLIAFLNNYNT
jgi:XTP/dITP diphosphohydrolase